MRENGECTGTWLLSPMSAELFHSLEVVIRLVPNLGVEVGGGGGGFQMLLYLFSNELLFRHFKHLFPDLGSVFVCTSAYAH